MKPHFPGLDFHALPNNEFGVLHNNQKTFAAPFVNGFAFFNESDFFSPQLLEQKCEEIYQKIYKKLTVYENFVRQKERRPNYDIYACFQPFNEAFKAFFPLIKAIKEGIQPGDIILNLWDRTGWSSAFLAGIFPEQQVINLWEGDKDILGYKGFRFWHQADNESKYPIQIAFADLNKPLPFADTSIALAFGLDTFHRFDQSLLLQELFRVCQPNAAILFPHVHLSNNEPEPFFERGCRQLHGLDYQQFFDKLDVSCNRKGYVFPEPKMFYFNELSDETSRVIKSEPDSHHYNAMIAILPSNWEKEKQLKPFRFADLADVDNCRVLINYILDINLHKNQIIQNHDHLEGRVGYLLQRHPIYLEKLAKNYKLNSNEAKVLYWASRLKKINEISKITAIPIAEIKEKLEEMQSKDILQVLPVTANHLRLQYFMSTQNYVLPEEKQTINALWKRAINVFPENSFIFSVLDDSELTYEECDGLMSMIIYTLHEKGLTKGDKVALICANHFEAILTTIACIRMGIVVVPIDYELAPPIIAHILEETQPKLIFSDQHHIQSLEKHKSKLIQLDSEENITIGVLFSEWLMEAETDTKQKSLPVASDDLACILYTSGSTGLPKGVMHSQGHLVRSARLITETFCWTAKDRFFSPGELDSMSGFRNYIVAPLEVGASIIIPDFTQKTHLFSLVETMEAYEASILGTTPVLLGQLLKYEKRVKSSLSSLKTIMCTGSYLSPQLKRQFFDHFQLVPLNYYGLTETTGICLSEDPENYHLDENTIGIPRGCIAQIVDLDGEIIEPGEQGLLRIYSENNMLGYFNNEKQTQEMIKNGWLYTGDIARWLKNDHIELLGRTRDIIKIATGQLVFASEIENSLLACKQLIAAAAVGAINSDEGEKIIAFLSLKQGVDTEESIIKEQLKKHLSEQIGFRKTPALWVFLDELPVSANGKVLKSALLEKYSSLNE